MIAKNSICELCGTAEYEWKENRRAYLPVETMCMGCYQKSLLEDDGNTRLPGTSVTLIKTGTTKYAKMVAEESRRIEAFGSDYGDG